MKNMNLQYEERIIFRLRELFEQFGYKRYRPRKFEEYDFYAKNKEFLISDQVISFTDTNGKLMALKPDVTLSMIRSQSANLEYIHKMYYTENVYRVSPTSQSFQEFMQMGLECMGELDRYSISEVLCMAVRSLQAISSSFVIHVSHLGIYEFVMEAFRKRGTRVPSIEEEILFTECISNKNTHDLARLCTKAGMNREDTEMLQKLVRIHDTPQNAIPVLKECGCDAEISEELEGIVEVAGILGLDGCLRIDASIVDDLNYYHGIVFRGFVEGVSDSVLRGGQYDKLSRKLGKEFGAIGFAIYLNGLEHLMKEKREFDVSSLIIYDRDVKPEKLAKIQRTFMEESFMMQTSIPKGLRYKKLFFVDRDANVTLQAFGKE